MSLLRGWRLPASPVDGIVYGLLVVALISFLNFLSKLFPFRNWLYHFQHAIPTVFFGLLSSFLIYSLRRNHGFRQKVAFILVSLTVAISIVEAILAWVPSISDNRVRAAVKLGINFDKRTKFEVVNDCRNKGGNCYPPVHPFMFLRRHLEVNGTRVLPLAGIANVTTVLCNESGSYTFFISDEVGFNNTVAGWSDTSAIDIVFIGDSFTEGSCVRPEDGFVAKLAKKYSGVVNLANSGNGPLFELATIREYLAYRKTKLVFWMYTERNDLVELYREVEDEILQRYLEKEFSQNLLMYREAVNAALANFIENQIEQRRRALEGGEGKRLINFSIFDLLPRSKQMLVSISHAAAEGIENRKRLPARNIELFGRILDEARRTVEKTGGRLVFVYLPEYGRYVNRPSSGAKMRDNVLRLTRSLALDVVDIDAAFKRTNDPLDLFPLGLDGHYNEKGNMVVAQALETYLETVGISR